MPHLLHMVRTSVLLKCFPLSVMNVSGGVKSWNILDKASTVVFAVLDDLYLNAHTCCE